MQCELSRSLSELSLDAWREVCYVPDDPFMDSRFLFALEDSLSEITEMWYLLIRDASGNPVAACCLSLFQLDACLMAGSFLRNAITYVRQIVPSALKLKVVFVGLPFSAGQSHLRIANGTDPDLVIQEVNRVANELAQQHRAPLIIYKEFNAVEQLKYELLTQLGYTKADSVSSNSIPVNQYNFDEYLGAMRDKYRRKIKASMRRFAKQDLRIEEYDGTADIESIYSETLHDLYLAIVDRSEAALERLPRSTIPALAKHFAKDFQLTVIYSEDEPIAFASGIYQGEAYYPLLGGVNYAWNEKTELYFNLVYEHFRQILQRPVRWIHFGASADEFKARLGAIQQSRQVYIKARGLLKWPFHCAKPLLLESVELRQPYRVMKQTEPTNESLASSL